MTCLLPLWTILAVIGHASAFTGEVRMDSCYDTTRRGYGFRITNGPIVSKVNCTMYFEAPVSDLHMAVRLNRVSLQKIGPSCPTLTVYSFSGWRTEPVPDIWSGSEVIVPADPSVMMTCNCSTYMSRCSNLEFFETNSPNLKIMLTYNPDDASRNVRRSNAFDVTISSFRREASSGCPAEYFGCWHYRHKCLPESLKCDGYDNCFDNSDEFDYTCTGRIGGMTLPVFIVMVLGCVLAACLILWIVIAIVQSRKSYNRMERNEWGEVIKANPQYPVAPSQYAGSMHQQGSVQYQQDAMPPSQPASQYGTDPYAGGSFRQY